MASDDLQSLRVALGEGAALASQSAALAAQSVALAARCAEVLSAQSTLSNSAEGFAPRPEWRPLTKFEARGLKLGHGVWDVVCLRR
jgi:tRNA G46 methylase TrmB